jgi:PLD-like domain
MVKFLGNEDTWRVLTVLSKGRNRPLWVAVPYLGNGAGRLLHLKHDDILVIALTEANSRNGGVCPDEICRLREKGVQVFIHSRLHAKVILCGNTAIVGSANLSQSSFSQLDEAAILTTDAKVVAHVRAWFEQRFVEPVTPEWLSFCGSVYRPPKGGLGRKNESAERPNPESLWLVGLRSIYYPDDVAGAMHSGAEEARKKLSDPSAFKIVTIRFRGTVRLREGDKIIQIMKAEDSHYVEELAKLIEVRKTRSRRGGPVAYLYLECRNRPKRMAWTKFMQGCASDGLKLGDRVGVRRITNLAQASKLMALVSRRTT